MPGELLTAGYFLKGGITGAGLLALVVCLWTFTMADAGWRRIPLWLTLPAFVGALVGAWAGLWAFSWWGASLGYSVMVLSGMPGGDRKAWAVAAGLLGLQGAAWASLLFFLILGALLRLLGPRMVGVPAFPILALVVGVVVWYGAG